MDSLPSSEREKEDSAQQAYVASSGQTVLCRKTRFSHYRFGNGQGVRCFVNLLILS